MTMVDTIPKTMRVAELRDVDDLHIVEYPTPKLASGELLVKIAASGICSGDLMPWYIRRKAPLVLGHEPTGTVVAVGEGAEAEDLAHRPFAIGDRVAIHHHAPCLTCRACVRRAYVQCPTWRATKLDPGGIAEYVRISRQNLVDIQHLPAHVAWEEAVLVEPLGCVMKSIHRAHLRPGDLVYVIGLGVMGLLHIAMLKSRGFLVIASDFLAERRERALELGAAAAVLPDDIMAQSLQLGFPDGPDVVICGPGNTAALTHAVETVAPDGTVVMFTPLAPDERFMLDQSKLYFRDITLTSSYSCGPNDTAEALTWLAQTPLKAKDFGVVEYPLDKTARAYEDMVKTSIIKALIRF